VKKLTPFEIEINRLLEEIQAEGIDVVAKRNNFKQNKDGKLDRRTKYGRIL
jgi:hypothetical protein